MNHSKILKEDFYIIRYKIIFYFNEILFKKYLRFLKSFNYLFFRTKNITNSKSI